MTSAGTWGDYGQDGSDYERREPGARRRKLAGYLKAANELRQTYQQNLGDSWAGRDGTQDANGLPGTYPDASVTKGSAKDEMLIFPSYATRHIKKKVGATEKQDYFSKLTITSQAPSQAPYRNQRVVEEMSEILQAPVMQSSGSRNGTSTRKIKPLSMLMYAAGSTHLTQDLSPAETGFSLASLDRWSVYQHHPRVHQQVRPTADRPVRKVCDNAWQLTTPRMKRRS